MARLHACRDGNALELVSKANRRAYVVPAVVQQSQQQLTLAES